MAKGRKIGGRKPGSLNKIDISAIPSYRVLAE